MSINRIEIKKFTVFTDITINTNCGINVIIGDNGTGKTHLLKLIYAVWLKRQDFLFFLNKIFYMHREFANIGYRRIEYDNNFIEEQLTESISKDESKESTYDGETWFVASGEVRAIIESTSLYYPVFIPAKEMLSMSNLTRIDDRFSNDLSIDMTLTDIIRKAQSIKPNKPPHLSAKITPILEKIINGRVFLKEDNSFWVRKNDQTEIPFSMEAEGYRKFGLIWQLIMNESIHSGSVLLWDEPEANINPRHISDLVKIMLELSRNSVQIFIATHDYFLAKYIEVLSNENDSIGYHSLYKTNDGVKCESGDKFTTLINNDIQEEKVRLYEAEINKVTG